MMSAHRYDAIHPSQQQDSFFHIVDGYTVDNYPSIEESNLTERERTMVEIISNALNQDLHVIGVEKLLLNEHPEPDHSTIGHMQRVSLEVGFLALRAGCPDSLVAEEMKAARVHDGGKVYISDIVKSDRKATYEDRIRIARHPAWGVDILDSMPLPRVSKLVRDLTGNHHMYLVDGSYGTDQGRPLDPRFTDSRQRLAVADYADAIWFKRLYQERTFTREEGVALITKELAVNPIHIRRLAEVALDHKLYTEYIGSDIKTFRLQSRVNE
jgi:hypothetical protein